MPVDSDGITYWELYYPTRTLDERINMREEMETLRRDANVRVTEGGLIGDLRSAGINGYIIVIVRFRSGEIGPASPALESILRQRERRPSEPQSPPAPLTRPGLLSGFSDVVRQFVGSQQSREDLISRAIASPEGRSRLAAAMAAPLRMRRDYQSVTRRTFLVEQLPDGALPVYDRDPGVGETVAEAIRRLGNMPLRPTTMFLNEEDYKDLQAWSNGDGEKILPLPEWCVVGAFVVHDKGQIQTVIGVNGQPVRHIARITQITDYTVILEGWASNLPDTIFQRDDKRPFSDFWSPTVKPHLLVTVHPVPTRFDKEEVV